MERQFLLKKIQDFLGNSQDANSIAQAEATNSFIRNNKNCFSRTNLEGHITGSCLLLSPDKEKVLLTHHKKHKQWIQLGGHSDETPNTLEVALKEAKEESGIEEIEALNESIFDISVHKISAYKEVPEHLHYDIIFLMHAKRENYIVSEESYDLAWFPLANIQNSIAEESVKRLATKLQSYLQSSKT